MKMKFAFLASTLAILLVGCRQDSKEKRPITISYDEWWSSDFAASGAALSCSWSKQGFTTEDCMEKDEARADEAAFLERLSAAFQADPICSDLRLVIYGGPGKNSSASYKELSEAKNVGYWDLIVDYHPKQEKQSWKLSFIPGDHYNKTEKVPSSGESTAQLVSHGACSIANQTGGSVIN